MKLGDIINCANEKDLKQTLRDLDLAGFHAVKDSGDNFDIRITGVPKISYVVKARDGRSAQAAYCDTLEEAEAAAERFAQGYEFVEILRGYPGEWETISQSW
jgi:hypothetical protein